MRFLAWFCPWYMGLTQVGKHQGMQDLDFFAKKHLDAFRKE
jgi:hypothetical protein